MLVIIVPVLKRPHRVVPLLESIEANTTTDHRVLFVCTPGDHEEIEAIEKVGAEHICTPVPYPSGDFAKKTNLAYRATWEPLMFLGADDLQFHPNWFERAEHAMRDGIGVIGTNDLTNRRTKRFHSTHSLVTREYVDQFGTIDEPNKVLHEGYTHSFVDDELVATAAFRGAYVHASNCHVEHLHPMAGKAPRDEVYDHGISQFEIDRRRFQARERLWT